MYIAVKGGERAIEASRALLECERRGERSVPALSVPQVSEQMRGAVGRVMAEGSLHDPELAALALLQAQGDSVEASFLLRAYRTTLPRWGHTAPLDTETMRVRRRISAIAKDLPGGQALGATYDYTQRLLDFGLLRGGKPGTHLPLDPCGPAAEEAAADAAEEDDWPSALAALEQEGVLEAQGPCPGDPEPPDITRSAPRYPMGRAGRLQLLARAEEGWLLGMAYSTQRGYANSHPFVGELRLGEIGLEFTPDELDFPIDIGSITVTECQSLHQFAATAGTLPSFTLGYGLVFGSTERKAIAMALVDRALRADELEERADSPAQKQEFVLPQSDGVEASGFVQHLKLPHYVTFESELQLLRQIRQGLGQAGSPQHASRTELDE